MSSDNTRPGQAGVPVPVRRWRWSRALGTAVVASVAAAGVAGAELLGPAGGGSGSPVTSSCRLVSFSKDGVYASGAGQVVGIAVRAGGWLDELRAVCMRFSGRNGMAIWIGTAATSLDAIGGRGGSGQPFQRLCPRDQVVVGMRGRAGWYVDSLRIACRAVTNRGRPTGSTTWLAAVGGGGGNAFGPLTCGGDGVVRDISGKGGNAVDSVAMSCDPMKFQGQDYR